MSISGFRNNAKRLRHAINLIPDPIAVRVLAAFADAYDELADEAEEAMAAVEPVVIANRKGSDRANRPDSPVRRSFAIVHG
jgi:hypothetical protein